MSGRKAVFIDRDGTLIELVPYLHRPEEVRLTPGAGEAVRRLGEEGWLRVLVTNQSGIARGLFSVDEVEAVHRRIEELLREAGGDLDGIEICPHHPDFTGVCNCRKPAPGMLQRAADRLAIDLSRSWIIGDRLEDLLAGHALGVRGILVLTGYGREEVQREPSAMKAVSYVAACFEDACRILAGIERQDGTDDGTTSPGGEPSD